MAILSSREQKRDYFFWPGRKAVLIDSHVTNCNDCNIINYTDEYFINSYPGLRINLISYSGDLYFDLYDFR